MSNWWTQKPRRISVVVDNDNNWFEPYAHKLCDEIKKAGDDAEFFRSQKDVIDGDVAFYLSCVNKTPRQIMDRHRVNLVCHASDLPRGKGFSPVTWQILEGKNDLPFCLFEMAEALDAGPVVFHDIMNLDGTELVDEIRHKQGEKTIELCLRYLSAAAKPEGTQQQGDESVYPRRRPADSALDIEKPLKDQMGLLRVADNENYPAFFIYQGRKYILKISRED